MIACCIICSTDSTRECFTRPRGYETYVTLSYNYTNCDITILSIVFIMDLEPESADQNTSSVHISYPVICIDHQTLQDITKHYYFSFLWYKLLTEQASTVDEMKINSVNSAINILTMLPTIHETKYWKFIIISGIYLLQVLLYV